MKVSWPATSPLCGELAHALRIDANNLAVNYGVLDGQLGERPLERLKSQVPLIGRNQLRLAVLQVRDRWKTVMFRFENVIGMVEGLPHQTEPHGVNAWQHDSYTWNAPRALPHVPALISQSPSIGNTENNSPPVLLQYLKTVVDGTPNRNVRGAGWDPHRTGSVPQGAGSCETTQPARHHRLKPMKHDLTLHHLKQEARDLLRGLERRDPEALRRCHAIDPLTDLSSPDLFYARLIIAREHGFSSWRKLKEHIDG